jgi:hypothetical protein
MAEALQELQSNLAEYREQLQQVCSPQSGVMLEYVFLLTTCPERPTSTLQVREHFLLSAVGGAAAR